MLGVPAGRGAGSGFAPGGVTIGNGLPSGTGLAVVVAGYVGDGYVDDGYMGAGA
jgi:hypothetical protein